MKQHYNPYVAPFMQVIDKDNGNGYHINVPGNGFIVTIPNSNTKVLYEIKHIESIKAIFIRYIHYDNKKELLSLLAFCCQWWNNLKPDIIYFKEKTRKNAAGVYLEQLGFVKKQIGNNLLPFNCNIDGSPCKCNVYEYYAYNIAATSAQKKQTRNTAAQKQNMQSRQQRQAIGQTRNTSRQQTRSAQPAQQYRAAKQRQPQPTNQQPVQRQTTQGKQQPRTPLGRGWNQ